MSGPDAAPEVEAREPAPCQCHRSHAYISPRHAGHCCFNPFGQTCHPAEVAAWLADQRRMEEARRG